MGFVSAEVSGQKLELGGGIGGLNYTGDISSDFNPRFFRPGGTLFLRYNLKNGLTLRAGGTGGMITADDQYAASEFQQQRGRAFRSLLAEGSMLAEYNFLDFKERRNVFNWSPYVLGGLGYMFFSPSPQTGSYRQTSLTIPFGVGVKIQVRRPWSVGVELAARKTFTDYLDDFGPEDISPDKYQNGNPALKDMYYYLGVSVSYTFYKIVCP